MRTKIHLSLFSILMMFSVCFAESEGVSTNQTYDLDPIFFMLGSTDEYMGRKLAKDSGFLEHFYADQEPAAKLYALYLEEALSDRSITTGYSVAVSEEGGHIYFYSKEIKEIINSYYDEVPDPMDLFSDGDVVGKLKSGIYDESHDLTLAYLAGAYSRYGESNSFHFANQLDKVERILEEIQYPNCEMVILTREYRLPVSSKITFEPGILDGLFTFVEKQKKDANQRVDLTVKTSVESGKEQGTAGHP